MFPQLREREPSKDLNALFNGNRRAVAEFMVGGLAEKEAEAAKQNEEDQLLSGIKFLGGFGRIVEASSLPSSLRGKLALAPFSPFVLHLCGPSGLPELRRNSSIR